MEENWFNFDHDDNFNPEEHGIEMDEIAKIYALSDIKESQREWAKAQAEKFYCDFEDLNIHAAASLIILMIKNKELELSNVNLMLDNMITIFQENEEYEKCHKCLQIKTEINDRI
jgi:hypothetical protein